MFNDLNHLLLTQAKIAPRFFITSDTIDDVLWSMLVFGILIIVMSPGSACEYIEHVDTQSHVRGIQNVNTACNVIDILDAAV